MIKLNARENDVEVCIEGNALDISRELNALIKTIKDSEQLKEVFTVALIVGDISEKTKEENTDVSNNMENFIKKMFGGKGNENLMS